MRIMAERAFPFPLLGLVHIGNEITPAPAGRARTSRCRSRVRAADLEPHDRGTQFTMARRGPGGEELVWESRNVYLHRSGNGGGSGGGAEGARDGGAARARTGACPATSAAATAPCRATATRSTCTRWSAKLFGMPRPIAHGMWLKARCLAELEPALPDAFSVDVRFKLPLFLPAQVAFGVRDGGAFEVRDAASGKPHLSGALSEGA